MRSKSPRTSENCGAKLNAKVEVAERCSLRAAELSSHKNSLRSKTQRENSMRSETHANGRNFFHSLFTHEAETQQPSSLPRKNFRAEFHELALLAGNPSAGIVKKFTSSSKQCCSVGAEKFSPPGYRVGVSSEGFWR